VAMKCRDLIGRGKRIERFDDHRIASLSMLIRAKKNRSPRLTIAKAGPPRRAAARWQL
jgi:hypothetical protein